MMSQKNIDQFKRRGLLLLIFGPGLFFLVYWLAMQPGKEVQVEKIKPPEQYLMLGQTATLEDTTYQAQAGDKLFTDTFNLKNNKAMAEPGYVFAGLGLKSNTVTIKPQVHILDSQGRLYTPLNVDQSLIAQNFGLSEKDCFLYLFKINSRSTHYYFQVKDHPALTWRIPHKED